MNFFQGRNGKHLRKLICFANPSLCKFSFKCTLKLHKNLSENFLNLNFESLDLEGGFCFWDQLPNQLVNGKEENSFRDSVGN